MEEEKKGRRGDRGLSSMDRVMLKRDVVVVANEEAGVECVDDGERGEIGKLGSEIPICDKDPSRSPSPNQRDSSNNEQENQLDSIKAEMVEVREENERLKKFLEQLVKDYQSLQMHFFDMVQKEQVKKPFKISSTLEVVEEPELVSLSLGTSASRNRKEEEPNTYNKSKEYERINEGLTLGLQCKFDGSRSNLSKTLSPDNSFEEPKEEDGGVPWPLSKAISKSSGNGTADVVLPQPPAKRARVSVRARCDAPTMNDGCQWRKYGQKIAKGNPCPRAYYRCTVGPACPVKKQVQRCAEDMSILITTYEGIHNHPLPMAATAMASSTSAAASMLMSGSSTTSLPALGSLAASFSTTSANLHGFSLMSDNSRLKQFFYPPNPSIYNSSNHPTVTLDLTAPSTKSNTAPPTYSWANGYSVYGARSFDQSHAGSLDVGRQYFLTEKIAKAITSDAGFQSALAAAITSHVGSQRAGMKPVVFPATTSP